MKIQKITLLPLIFFIALSCENGQKSYNGDQPNTHNSTNPNPISSTAATENNKDSARKFIRTADVKFRVIDVLATTYRIETITLKNKGFVTFTNLSSQVNPIPSRTLSNDSLLESTEVRVSNTMTIRVPNTELDTVLREIAQNIEFLDYRVIKAEDATLQVLSNTLEQNRLLNNKSRLAANNNDEVKKQYDDAKISQLRLADAINFSTIHLLIYQSQSIQRRVIANTQNIENYKPSFGYQIQEALRDGWNVFEVIIVFFAKLWGLILLVIITFVIFRFVKGKFDK